EALVYLQQVACEGSDAHFLRRKHLESGNAEGMVDAALERFRTGR
ncbi:MAG: glutamate--cysteine ligase, partial [Rhizobiales bacterium]|nr:glutamate--cysteine ligase [Hyphomicrobiales bacterium]